MTYPASDVVTTNLDAGTDSPATARSDLLDLATKFNLLRNHITSFMQTFLNRSTAALARADLGVAPRATRIDVASVAGTVDLTTNAPDTDDIQITGTNTITAFTVAVGRVIRVRASGAHTLTNNSSIVTQRGANIVCAAGDTYVLRATAANVVEVMFYAPRQRALVDVTSSRAFATDYTNTTGQDIDAYVLINISASTAYSIEVDIGAFNSVSRMTGTTDSGGDYKTLFFTVPPGLTYQVQASTGTVTQWTEYK